MRRRRINDQDLQAFLDGELDPARRRAFVTALETDPAALKKLAEYAAQNDALHRLFDFVLRQEVPARIRELLKQRN